MDLPFELVGELEDPSGPIGQDRAVEAVEFAVHMRRKGYNIYALGPSGTGKHTVIEHLLRQRADSMKTPPDWCYVNNFTDPQKPHRLQLPPGRATGLREAMRRLVEELRAALPAAFERDDYRARREVIDQQFRQRNEQAFGELQPRAEQKGIAMLRTPMGLALGAAARRQGADAGDVRGAARGGAASGSRHDLEDVQGELEAVMQKVPQWEREHREAVRELNRETTGAAIAVMMNELRAGYRDLPDVAQYLDAVEHDIKENADDFLPAAQPREGTPIPAAVEEAPRPASAPTGSTSLSTIAATRRPRHLRGQPDPSDPGRPGRAHRPFRHPRHRLQPLDAGRAASRQWRLSDPRCATAAGRELWLGFAEARAQCGRDPH